MKIFEIKWNNMITEEKTIHADFGKYQGDLVGNKTIWLYPTKGAYDFKDQIKKLIKAYGKAKVDPHEMDSRELTFAKAIPNPKDWADVLKQEMT